MEAAPTCFGLQRIHHQGDTASAQLKLKDWFSVDIDAVQTLSVLWRHFIGLFVSNFKVHLNQMLFVICKLQQNSSIETNVKEV